MNKYVVMFYEFDVTVTAKDFEAEDDLIYFYDEYDDVVFCVPIENVTYIKKVTE